jgi:hypothetical protein
MTDISKIPDDMWKVADLATFEIVDESVNVLFHHHPVPIFRALLTGEKMQRQSDGLVMEIPVDLSKQSRLMLGTACASALASLNAQLSEYMSPMNIKLN